jgi:hypothetical protein
MNLLLGLSADLPAHIPMRAVLKRGLHAMKAVDEIVFRAATDASSVVLVDAATFVDEKTA